MSEYVYSEIIQNEDHGISLAMEKGATCIDVYDEVGRWKHTMARVTL